MFFFVASRGWIIMWVSAVGLFNFGLCAGYFSTPNGALAPSIYAGMGLGFQLLALSFYKEWVADIHRCFFGVVAALTAMASVFVLIYGAWLDSKGEEHLVVVTKSSAILRLIHVTFPMGTCLSAQNGLYFSEICLLVVPFLCVTTSLLVLFYKKSQYTKDLLPGYPYGLPDEYYEASPLYLSVWQNGAYAGFGILFATIGLLKSRIYEYQERKLFIERYVLRLRIKVDDLIAYHHERTRRRSVTMTSLVGAYNWSRKGRKRNMKYHWEITEKQLRFDPADVIGKGSFGTVLKGHYNRTEFDGDDEADPVALKRFEASNDNLNELFHELRCPSPHTAAANATPSPHFHHHRRTTTIILTSSF
jgi:hypothetical protein